MCGFDNNTCGQNPDPNLANDPELDPRFKANSNFIVARNSPITISTGPSMNNNKRCTYIIKTTFSKVGLVFEILQNLNVEIHYFKGGRSFDDLTLSATWARTLLNNQKWEWPFFEDDNYLYIQATGRSEGSFLQFRVSAVTDKVLPSTPPPGITPGTPPPAPPTTTPILEAKKGGGSNMALIIGIIVGALGFVAIGGFLVYYIMKRKRMEADQLAEEDPDEDMAPVSQF